VSELTHWLSFGAGVNSVAYYMYMIEKEIKFEAVFAHHGSDYPETYEYMDYFNNELVKRGYKPVTVIEGNVKEKEMDEALGLYDYCLLKKTVPQRMKRWCTEKFKILPVNDYINSKLKGGLNEKCYYHLGIAWDEQERANPPQNPPTYLRNKIYKYLFVEDGITRADNIEIIKKHGLKVPIKSGCYYCPFQPDREFRRLYENYPCLYEKAKRLEHEANARRKAKGLSPTHIRGDKFIEDIAQEGQIYLDVVGSEYDIIVDQKRPCNCGL
jgi:3'-phosphoadenosine 5'-phosphosulfate sulfotransferase (PAPS reductase)/FAD synthetase